MYDEAKIKKDFPIFKNNKDLVYLDNAATSQKPQIVIDAMDDFYKKNNANIHRGIYKLSEQASKLYDEARKKVADFIGALPEEIIFTRGTTESLNNIALNWAVDFLKKNDEILISDVEHNSNFLPWKVLAERKNLKSSLMEVDKEGEISLKHLEEKLDKGVKLVSVTHVSNVLGNTFPISQISKLTKKYNAKLIVDGAQAVPHIPVDVKKLGCDFYAFSAHKMLGPMGIGVLWVKKDILENMKPFEYGGGMVEDASVDNLVWAPIPYRFEAGTPNVAGAVGLGAAIDYLEKIGFENIWEHEKSLVEYAMKKLSDIKNLEILGPQESRKRTGLISFTIKGIHPHDIATVLDSENIAVRAGTHCAMLYHKKLGIAGSVRASFYLYNSFEDIDKLAEALLKAVKILG